MIISGVLLCHDNKHAIIRQHYTSHYFAVRLKDLQIEKNRDGSLVKYNGKLSVRITGFPCVPCDQIIAYNITDNLLSWKTKKELPFSFVLES